MDRRLYFYVCMFSLIHSLNCMFPLPIRELNNEDAKITCHCQKWNSNRQHTFDWRMTKKNVGQIHPSNYSTSSFSNYPQLIHTIFKNCEFCELKYTKCENNSSDVKGGGCKKHTVGFKIPQNELLNPEYTDTFKRILSKMGGILLEKQKQISGKVHEKDTDTPLNSSMEAIPYTMRVFIPIGGLNQRFKRQMESCHYPTSLQASELDCIISTQKVRCTQTCAFGHAIDSKRKLQYTCRTKTNQWKPHNFKECQPYVDCTVMLVSGGKSSCSNPTLTSGPVCSIECYKYEDKEATGRQSHSCNKNGKWEPRLPFCAHPGTEIALVDPPQS